MYDQLYIGIYHNHYIIIIKYRDRDREGLIEQESGRAGRDGLQSESVVYYNKDDALLLLE